jgi:hypothetical protein
VVHGESPGHLSLLGGAPSGGEIIDPLSHDVGSIALDRTRGDSARQLLDDDLAGHARVQRAVVLERAGVLERVAERVIRVERLGLEELPPLPEASPRRDFSAI